MKKESNTIMGKESLHTKGEWILEAPTFYANRRRINVSDKEVGLVTIAVIEDYTDNKEEAEANAKLIVTAVNNHAKLIEALQNIISMNGVGYKDAQQFSDDLQPLIEDANQLLTQIKEQSK